MPDPNGEILLRLAAACPRRHPARKAERTLEELRAVMYGKEQETIANFATELCQSLGQEAWQTAQQRGRQMSLAQAIAYATQQTG